MKACPSHPSTRPAYSPDLGRMVCLPCEGGERRELPPGEAYVTRWLEVGRWRPAHDAADALGIDVWRIVDVDHAAGTVTYVEEV